jgi:hypothetical protein
MVVCATLYADRYIGLLHFKRVRKFLSRIFSKIIFILIRIEVFISMKISKINFMFFFSVLSITVATNYYKICL